MADRHIDYHEVSEYGRHFVREVTKLESTAGALVDIGALRSRVLTAVETVEARLQTSSTRSSTLRTGRGSARDAAGIARDAIKRFYHYLLSLPAGTPMDLMAFYAGGKLGEIYRLKHADLLARADAILRGFDSPANSGLPQGAAWQATLAAARADLFAALDGKSAARSDGRWSTDELASARKDFLHIYNKVAKRLVRAVLADLGREHEYRRFFLDMQLSEGNHAQPAAKNGAGASGNTAGTTPSA